MQIIKLLISEKVTNAKFALNKASSEEILKLCQDYFQLLDEYYQELIKLNDGAAITTNQTSTLARELVEQTRKAIQVEVDLTTRERDQMELLIKSFTTISGYEAVQTFNQLEYKGFNQWEMRAQEVRLKNDDNGEKMTVQEAVAIASLLRRKAYVIYKTTFFEG